MEKLPYSPREAALLLSISRSKLYELMAAGELDSIQVGRVGSRPTPWPRGSRHSGEYSYDSGETAPGRG